MTTQPIILTTPSRREQLVPSIVAAFTGVPGLHQPLVFCDDDGAGAAAATQSALRLAAIGGDHVLFLEDDLLVDPAAPAQIAAAEFPAGVAVISYCDMREVPEFSPAGLYRLSPLGSDGRGWWGNQALLIHRDTAQLAAGADWFAPYIQESRGVRGHIAQYEDDGRNCSDIRLALLIDRLGGDRREYAVHVPSLLKHVGHDSQCFPGRGMGERETRNWIGDRRRFGVDEALTKGN